MLIVTKQRIGEWATEHKDAATALTAWYEVARMAHWHNLQEVRGDFRSADGVTVASGKVVTVFNVRGNKYRMLTAIHYNHERVFMMRFMTHAEYDKNAWKAQL